MELAIAGVDSRAACAVALDEVQLGDRGVCGDAVGQFAGQAATPEGGLAGRLAGFAGCCAGAGGRNHFLSDRFGLGRMLFEVLGERRVGGAINDATDVRVTELRLGLPFELWFRQAHGDDCGQAFGNVLAGQVLVLLLEQAVGPRVGVDDARDGGAEANEVAAAFVRVDGVREGVDRRLVRLVPLQGDVDLDAALFVARTDHDDARVHELFALVHEGDVLTDAAFVLPCLVGAIATLVDQAQGQDRREERHLAHAEGERVAVEADVFEDLAVGQEGDRRAALAAPRLALAERVLRIALGVILREDEAVAAHFDVQLLGQRVDDGDADAVQTTGDLVAAAAEFTAGVQLGENNLDSGHALVGHHLDGDTAPVIDAGRGAVCVQRDRDLGAVPGKRFVNRVVEHLPDQVMEAASACRTDVHTGAPAHGLKAFEDGDIAGAVGLGQGLLPGCSPVGERTPNSTRGSPRKSRIVTRFSGFCAFCD